MICDLSHKRTVDQSMIKRLLQTLYKFEKVATLPRAGKPCKVTCVLRRLLGENITRRARTKCPPSRGELSIVSGDLKH